MKRSYFIGTIFILATIAGLSALFLLPYRTVRERTIVGFNHEQILLLRQAAQGIEESFALHGRALRYFTGHPSIVHLDDRGRAMLQEYYAIHTPGLISIARLDPEGQILFRVSSTSAIAADRIDEAFAQVTAGPEFAVQEFTSGRTLLTAYSAPLSVDGKPGGSLVLLLSVDQIRKKFVEPLRAGQNRRI